MNECEQIHPLLKGFMDDKLSGTEKRLVARHLNLCTGARRDLDLQKKGGKTQLWKMGSFSVPWDQKILNWMFRTPESADHSEKSPAWDVNPPGPNQKKTAKPPGSGRYILWIVLFFITAILVTHFVQNGTQYKTVRETRRWLANHGFGIFGAKSTLELVLDVTNLPHWEGNAAPVAFEYGQYIKDPRTFRVFWMFLKPMVSLPPVDFSKNALIIQFAGQKNTAGYSVEFKRMEFYTDKTVLWFEEIPPGGGKPMASAVSRPWQIQVIPKPGQVPVFIQRLP